MKVSLSGVWNVAHEAITMLPGTTPRIVGESGELFIGDGHRYLSPKHNISVEVRFFIILHP